MTSPHARDRATDHGVAQSGDCAEPVPNGPVPVTAQVSTAPSANTEATDQGPCAATAWSSTMPGT